MSSTNSRRKFIEHTLKVGAASALATTLPSTLFGIGKSTYALSDTINIALIGMRGMGFSNVTNALELPGIKLAAVCDVDSIILNEKLAALEAKGQDISKVKVYSNYQKMLEQKDIDVVIIGTPDHWHALQMIHACQAGKHVYLEKPAGNSIGECNSMLKAQQHYQKIVQVGQWQRSQQHFADAVAFIQKGDLGNIRTVKTWCYQSWLKPGEVIPNTASPATFDYKQWIGPAPMRPYNPNHTHFHFRWFWDFAGGLMTDWGVHLLDYALIGMNAKLPKTVTALGGKFAYPSLYQETPDTLTTLYEFDKFVLTWDSAMGISNGPYYRNHGIAFVGNNGTLILTRDGWEVLEEAGNKTKTAIPFIKAAEPNGIKAHLQNFFDAIRQNKPGILKCSLQEGVHTAAVAQMGNIAYRSGKKVFWDKQKQMFTDAELNKKYFTNTYHNGYKLPI